MRIHDCGSIVVSNEDGGLRGVVCLRKMDPLRFYNESKSNIKSMRLENRILEEVTRIADEEKASDKDIVYALSNVSNNLVKRVCGKE